MEIEKEIYNQECACISIIKDEDIYGISMYTSHEKQRAYACWFKNKEEIKKFAKTIVDAVDAL